MPKFRLKESRYNFILPRTDGQWIFYNTLKNGLAIVNEKEYDIFKSICQTGKSSDLSTIDSLLYGGFVVEETLNELELVRHRLLQTRYANKTLSLTIAPTSDCNFRCTYCYEKDTIRQETMDIKTQDALISWIKDNARYYNALAVVWYGGEPLLAMDTIERLSENMIAISKDHKIPYSAYIVTNGYLLSPSVVKRLNDCPVTGMQITLDGNKEAHDKRRFLKDGQGTYTTILKHLEQSIHTLNNVSVRINIDKENQEKAMQVIEDIKSFDLHEKIKPYFARVENHNQTYDDMKCLSEKHFDQFERETMREDATWVWSKYPRLIASFCGADNDNAYIIAPNGDLYKCWSDLGYNERSVGNIKRDPAIDVTQGRYLDYMLFDATQDEECEACKFLPVCMGGCPYSRVEHNGKKECTMLKDTLCSDLQQMVDTADLSNL